MSSSVKTKYEADPNSFVAIRRQIKSDVLSGRLPRQEYILLSWLFLNSDMYGKVTVNLNSLRDDMFPRIKPDSVGKLLKSLRSKRYIYYDNHRGQRGSFELYLDYWLIEYKVWRRITAMFETGITPKDEIPESEPQAEVTPTSDTRRQNYFGMKSQFLSGFGSTTPSPQVRSAYTEKETQNEKYIIDGNNISSKEGRIPVGSYIPTNNEESRCYEIALKLGETHMDFLLSVLESRGLGIIERALGSYREMADKTSIINPAAYVNTTIQKLIEEEDAGKLSS